MLNEDSEFSRTTIPKQVVSGVSWLFVGCVVEFLAQSISLIVLARLLKPQDFGIFSIGLILRGVGEACFGVGLGSAVVQNTLRLQQR